MRAGGFLLDISSTGSRQDSGKQCKSSIHRSGTPANRSFINHASAFLVQRVALATCDADFKISSMIALFSVSSPKEGHLNEGWPATHGVLSRRL